MNDRDADLRYYEVQSRGARQGLNPMAGEWRRRFDFAPVSYSASALQRREFKRRIRSELGNKFVFSDLVKVTLTLMLDEQTVLESDAYGDLDNCAKLINDALKGRDGLIIDDCQIYRLDVAWEIARRPAVDVEIKVLLHDGFVLKEGLKLYGMRDGLYYPQAAVVWRDGEVVPLTPFEAFVGLLVWESMTGSKRSLRHAVRQRGGTRLEAFELAQFTTPTQLGFHRSRAIASELPIVEHATWREAAAAFNIADPENRLLGIERMLAEHGSLIGSITETYSEGASRMPHRSR